MDNFLSGYCLPVSALIDYHQLVTASVRRYTEVTSYLVRELPQSH